MAYEWLVKTVGQQGVANLAMRMLDHVYEVSSHKGEFGIAIESVNKQIELYHLHLWHIEWEAQLQKNQIPYCPLCRIPGWYSDGDVCISCWDNIVNTMEWIHSNCDLQATGYYDGLLQRSARKKQAIVLDRGQEPRRTRRYKYQYHNPRYQQLALEYFGYTCAICGRQFRDLFGDRHLAWDHWIPFSKGGKTEPVNMLPVCGGRGGCNTRKNNSDPIEWLHRHFNPHRARGIQNRIAEYFEWIKNRVSAEQGLIDGST